MIIIIIIENCRGTYTFTKCIDVLAHSALEFPVDGDSSYITPLHMPITLESLHNSVCSAYREGATPANILLL